MSLRRFFVTLMSVEHFFHEYQYSDPCVVIVFCTFVLKLDIIANWKVFFICFICFNLLHLLHLCFRHRHDKQWLCLCLNLWTSQYLGTNFTHTTYLWYLMHSHSMLIVRSSSAEHDNFSCVVFLLFLLFQFKSKFYIHQHQSYRPWLLWFYACSLLLHQILIQLLVFLPRVEIGHLILLFPFLS